ncbi:glycosyl transferase [Spirochaetia bacterium]|nr:glycosyl transferase [Spirochaetia bacterium]
MKKISINIQCLNEERNIIPLTNKIISILERDLPQYDYEIIFSDNCSTDNTRLMIRELCKENKKIKAILNTRNFGASSSGSNCSMSATGDCIINLFADFQSPPDMIPQFVKEWENGYKIVLGIKTKSKENILMLAVRRLFYIISKKFSEFSVIDNFCGFSLFDRSFFDLYKTYINNNFDGKGFIAYTGIKRKDIPYIQPKRQFGKSKYNFYRYWNEAMIVFTSNTKAGLRIATFSGMILGAISFIIAMVYLVLKLLYWDSFDTGYAPMVIGVFLLGSFQLFFIGLLGEYVMAINTRQMNWPLVMEEERINFDAK